jgi:hypothetical protein
VERVSTRDAFLNHRELDVIAKSGALGSDAQVLDLAQHERALVWLNGRFSAVVPPGLTAIWTEFHEVRAEVVDAREIRFVHPEQRFILASPTASAQLEQVSVDAEHRALVFVDGELTEELGPGAYAFWRDVARVKVLQVDLREQVLDVSGQEIMTADKVTLRLNALVTFRVTDARQAVTATGDHEQALYRQAQLAVREVIGGRDLESLLVDRQAVSADLLGEVRQRSKGLGVGRGCPGYPRRHPARRHARAAEPSDGGAGGRPGGAHPPSRGDCGHALAGQHRQAAGVEPDPDAAARAGGPGIRGRQGPADRGHG